MSVWPPNLKLVSASFYFLTKYIYLFTKWWPCNFFLRFHNFQIQKDRRKWTDLWYHELTQYQPVPAAPPFCRGDNFQPQILKRGEQKKKWVPGGLTEFLPWIFHWGWRGNGGGAYYVSCQKKIWLWGLSFKCWSWPVLAKQPINV